MLSLNGPPRWWAKNLSGLLGGGGGGRGTPPAAGGQVTGKSIQEVARDLTQAIDRYLDA